MSRELTPERLEVLERVAVSAVASNAFPQIKQPGHWEPIIDGRAADAAEVEAAPKMFVPDRTPQALESAQAAAFLVLLAAEERGMAMIDALNRARFGEDGLTFAPATTETFDASVRAAVDASQKDEKRERALNERAQRKSNGAPSDSVAEEKPVVMPEGFPGTGRPLGSFTVGELAYFIDAADKRGGHAREVDVAWARLAEKLQTANSLDLGKLQRWIVNAKFPHLREKFADVLVVAERRLAERWLAETHGGQS